MIFALEAARTKVRELLTEKQHRQQARDEASARLRDADKALAVSTKNYDEASDELARMERMTGGTS